MNYSSQVTSDHPLAHRYQKLIDVILKNEGARTTPFVAEVAIDIDQYEIEKNRGIKRDNTMDFTIGLTNRQMLLVEAKLRVKKPGNLSKNELGRKIIHSKEILIGHGVPVAKEKVFLFNEDVIGQARFYISRLFQNNTNLKVYTIQEFKNNIFNP